MQPPSKPKRARRGWIAVLRNVYQRMKWWERLFVVLALAALLVLALAVILMFPVH